MIPRRRVPVGAADVTEWLGTALHLRRSSDEDVSRFERAFAEYLGCDFARATMSGRDAIALAMDAVGAGPGDEVIVPAYTLGELVPVLQGKGLQPVPADIQPDTFNVDPDRVAERISPRTRAILATHLLGAPCEIEAICRMARERGVAVVEDCAHGLGATVSGKKVGTFGDAAIFSLEVNKAVPTYGGGMLVTSNPKTAESVASTLAERPRREAPVLKKALSTWIEESVIRSPMYAILARILFSEKYAKRFEERYRDGHDRLRATKSAYTGFQARLGARRLAKVDDRNERLNTQWDALANRLPDVLTPQVRDRVGRPAFYNFVALSAIEPGRLRQQALRRGVDLGIGSEVMDDCGPLLGADDCPVAARVARQAVLLPLYDGLSDRRFDRLVTALEAIATEEGG